MCPLVAAGATVLGDVKGETSHANVPFCVWWLHALQISIRLFLRLLVEYGFVVLFAHGS